MALKGPEIQLKMGQFLHYPKEKIKQSIPYLFHAKIQAPYQKIEIEWITTISFGIMQKFRPFSRPFRPTVEKNYLVNFGAKSSQLFKNVQDLKIGRKMAIGPPQ